MNMNNNGQNNYKPSATSVYSKYGCVNGDKVLTYFYWNKLLCISVKKIERDSFGKPIGGSDEELGKIFISPTKARMLAEMVRRMLNTDTNMESDTVRSNETYLQLINNKGHLGFIIFQPTKSGGYSNVEFIFPDGPESYITERSGFKDINEDFNKNIYIEEFITILNEYACASTFATAATVVAATDYRTRRMSESIAAIANKLGIQSGRSSGNSGQIFNSSNRGNYTSRPDDYDDYE